MNSLYFSCYKNRSYKYYLRRIQLFLQNSEFSLIFTSGKSQKNLPHLNDVQVFVFYRFKSISKRY